MSIKKKLYMIYVATKGTTGTIDFIILSSEIIHLETSNATTKDQYPSGSKTGLHGSIHKISASKKHPKH